MKTKILPTLTVALLLTTFCLSVFCGFLMGQNHAALTIESAYEKGKSDGSEQSKSEKLSLKEMTASELYMKGYVLYPGEGLYHTKDCDVLREECEIVPEEYALVTGGYACERCLKGSENTYNNLQGNR